MTTQASPAIADGDSLGASQPSLAGRLGALTAHVAAWIETCTGYYQAAARYDQLAWLSDAELHRRGLSRATLAREVCAACAPPMGR
jgi:hypothetical protein